MLDNTKFLVTDLEIINKMLLHPDFVVCRPKNNYYHSLKHKNYGIKLSLDFRKAVANGKVIGYGHLEVNISPHYHFNGYQHNGDDFGPVNCINSLLDIMDCLNIQSKDFELLRVVNLEFGLNIISQSDIKNLIDGISFYKKTPFKKGSFPYFKKTDATTYKLIKAYAKGLQFAEIPQYGIDINTFRFEVKTKQAKNIKTYGIYTLLDLLKLDSYSRLGQSLLNEWCNVLLLDILPQTEGNESGENNLVIKGANVGFWSDLISQKHRNTFQINKEKYYNMLQGKNNIYQQVKVQIIDKLFSFLKCANSTQGTPINRTINKNHSTPSNRINLESAHFSKCIITGLDISTQRKGSKFIRENTLKILRENEPETYGDLERKYLTEKMKIQPLERQFYYLAHNIRNEVFNVGNNRKRFEQRNYNKQQLQFNF